MIINIIIPHWIFVILWQWCCVLFCNSLLVILMNCFCFWDFNTVLSNYVILVDLFLFLIFIVLYYFLRYIICFFVLSVHFSCNFPPSFYCIFFFVMFPYYPNQILSFFPRFLMVGCTSVKTKLYLISLDEEVYLFSFNFSLVGDSCL